MDVEPLAVVVLPELPPIAIDCAPDATTDPPRPPAEYCACATLPTLAPATRTAVATAFTTADLFGLPRAESCSDAATQAPRASFQIERYVRFISYLPPNNHATHRSLSLDEYAVRSRES